MSNVYLQHLSLGCSKVLSTVSILPVPDPGEENAGNQLLRYWMCIAAAQTINGAWFMSLIHWIAMMFVRAGYEGVFKKKVCFGAATRNYSGIP